MATRLQQRRIPVVLPGDLYKKLEQLADADERDAWQQARWLLQQAIVAQHQLRFAAAPPKQLAEQDVRAS